MTFLKVNAMPPPMIISSTLSIMFLISWILSATFAPPRMARNGRSGAVSAYQTLHTVTDSLARLLTHLGKVVDLFLHEESSGLDWDMHANHGSVKWWK